MRLIDADALKNKIEQHSYPLSDRINSIENGMFLCGIYQAVDESPTADVVPVVRCKECKHWYEYSCNEEYGICHFWQANDNENTETESDDFCSYGQRKE